LTTHDWIRAHYLDASALVKLVADDPDEVNGKDVLRAYYRSHCSSMYATSYCVAETLSVFKAKLNHRKITAERYIGYVQDFIRRIVGVNLRIDELPILSPTALIEGEQIFTKYGIDFIDCFQIVTILHGRFCVLGPNSQSILITADEGLAKAAIAEGARVWNCARDPAPQ
jgi:predicted nucleic acid-binding protein